MLVRARPASAPRPAARTRHRSADRPSRSRRSRRLRGSDRPVLHLLARGNSRAARKACRRHCLRRRSSSRDTGSAGPHSSLRPKASDARRCGQCSSTHAEPALAVAEGDQIFAEQPNAHRRAVRLRDFLRHARGKPMLTHQRAHRRIAFDAAQQVVVRGSACIFRVPSWLAPACISSHCRHKIRYLSKDTEFHDPCREPGHPRRAAPCAVQHTTASNRGLLAAAFVVRAPVSLRRRRARKP